MLKTEEIRQTGPDPSGRSPQSPPLKPTKVALFTMILYNSEYNIGDQRLLCRPLFCHSSDL